MCTAIPIALIIGPAVPRQYVMPAAILVLGLLTVVYTYRGGMKAVVWTELVQAGVYLLGGISAVVLLGRAVPGGWGAIIQQASAAGKLQAVDFYTGIDRPHTVFAGLLGGAFLAMASHGADQLIVQRLLSAKRLRDAQDKLLEQVPFVSGYGVEVGLLVAHDRDLALEAGEHVREHVIGLVVGGIEAHGDDG